MLPSLGTLGAGGSVNYTRPLQLVAREYDHHAITFSAGVSLSGTVSATTGAVGFRLYNNQGALISVFTAADDSFTDVPVPAGSYVVQIPTVSVSFGGGDVDSYTISLTAAP